MLDEGFSLVFSAASALPDGPARKCEEPKPVLRSLPGVSLGVQAWQETVDGRTVLQEARVEWATAMLVLG